MFADDIKIVRKVDCRLESELLQSDLNALYTWCTNKNFTLNIKKMSGYVIYQDSDSY